MAKIAMYWDEIEYGKVHCSLCPHNCIIKPGGIGACRARKNIDGSLYSMNYGKIASLALDHIEKKPLYRFHPGKQILSAGTFGCNLKCSFCQNWGIAHENPKVIDISPELLVSEAINYIKDGNIGIAYTYNEPSIWYEYVYESSRLAKEKGLFNVLVTNGFISKEPLEALLPYIDAMNIDVKGYTASFYEDICKGTLEDVKRTVEISAKHCHVEVTTLVIPEYNDAIEEIN
ncbi:MAG: pyruvate-formate lyase-activating enzyme, partial [Clostridiales bacterium]|nr:pyruvate-formate lyase-activating enzyme [Clostridiales bacterium]